MRWRVATASPTTTSIRITCISGVRGWFHQISKRPALDFSSCHAQGCEVLPQHKPHIHSATSPVSHGAPNPATSRQPAPHPAGRWACWVQPAEEFLSPSAPPPLTWVLALSPPLKKKWPAFLVARKKDNDFCTLFLQDWMPRIFTNVCF